MKLETHPMSVVVRVGAFALGGYMFVLAGLKWVGGHDPAFALAPWAFHAAAAVEVVLGLLCCSRRHLLTGLSGVVLLFAVAAGWALVRGPGTGSCGCMGQAVTLLWREQLLVALGSGAAASALLAGASAARQRVVPA